MSLANAQRILQWNVVHQALHKENLGDEIFDLVENARNVYETVQTMAAVLQGTTDEQQVKNYIKVELTGMTPPFDRAYIELVRPGGKTSHQLREMLRARLVHVRMMLEEGDLRGDINDELLTLICADLAAEAP